MNSDRNQSLILPVFTAVLWIACATVGALGIWMRYPFPRAPATEPPPVRAEFIKVQVAENAQAPAPAPLRAPQISLPPLAQPLAPPPMPQMIAVAEPPPLAPSRQLLETTRPIAIASTQLASPAPPDIRRITYGQGEGIQPAPEYPREAQIARQQGTVDIEFTTADDGRVRTARMISPCPFALLNQAALRAVRETWRFDPGPPRVCRVAIHFELKRN
jgi:TonB family protein